MIHHRQPALRLLVEREQFGIEGRPLRIRLGSFEHLGAGCCGAVLIAENTHTHMIRFDPRSEERRGGKECKCGGGVQDTEEKL